jgi:translocator protein
MRAYADLRNATWRDWLVLALLLATVFAVAAIGASVTTPKIAGWYESLSKPSFQPPSWVFGPVWTVLYLLMAVAAWRVWLAPDIGVGRRRGLIWFAIQLGLNALWSPAFFGFEAPRLALGIIVLLLVALLYTTMRFFAADRLAGWLMVPYLAWVAFATLLNASIVWLN